MSVPEQNGAAPPNGELTGLLEALLNNGDLDETERSGIVRQAETLGHGALFKILTKPITDTEREQVFSRTPRMGYEARQRRLSAKQNGGQAAVVMDPLESPLWYVDLPKEFLDDPAKRERLLILADRVLLFANRVMAEMKTDSVTVGDAPPGDARTSDFDIDQGASSEPSGS
jgi:hypothetical protein